jgi:hypothetical protein
VYVKQCAGYITFGTGHALGPEEPGTPVRELVQKSWEYGHLWVAKTPSRRKQTQSIDAKRDVREGGSDPAHKEWATDRGWPHVQKRDEPTGTFGPASAGAAKAVFLKLPGAGNDDGGHRPRATR